MARKFFKRTMAEQIARRVVWLIEVDVPESEHDYDPGDLDGPDIENGRRTLVSKEDVEVIDADELECVEITSDEAAAMTREVSS